MQHEDLYLLFPPEYLVDQHAGEDAHEDPDDGEAEHGPEAGVDRPVDHLAVGGGCEDVAQCGWKIINDIIKMMSLGGNTTPTSIHQIVTSS